MQSTLSSPLKPRKLLLRAFFAVVPALLLAAPLWAADKGIVDDSDNFRDTDEIAIPHNDNAGIMHYDVESVPHAPRLPEKIVSPAPVAHPSHHVSKTQKKPRRSVKKKGAVKKTPAKPTPSKAKAPAKVRKVSMLSGHPLPGTYGKYHVAGPKAYPYKHYPFGRPNMHPKGSGQRF